MDKKEEKHRRILPPIEELVGTPDLINEALRKVIPPSPSKERAEQSDSSPSAIVQPLDRVQKPEKKLQKQSTARLPHSLVTAELGHDDSAIIDPSHDITQLQYDSAITYPSRTYLITPHFLLDDVLPTLNAYEQSLLLRLYRLSYGFRRNVTDSVGKKTLADKCNMSIGMVKKVLKSLEKRGLIKAIPDKSNDPTKGNKYRVLTRFSDNPVILRLSHNIAQSQHDPIRLNTIDDDQLKIKNHHLKKVKELYETLTGNKWSKSDDDSYLKIQEVNLEIIDTALRISNDRAKSHPNSFEFFVKQIQRLANPSEEERKKLKAALGKLVNFTRQVRVGGEDKIALQEDVKRRCEEDGVFFDEELYQEILDESYHGHWEPR
jgi:hypothetical protein